MWNKLQLFCSTAFFKYTYTQKEYTGSVQATIGSCLEGRQYKIQQAELFSLTRCKPPPSRHLALSVSRKVLFFFLWADNFTHTELLSSFLLWKPGRNEKHLFPAVVQSQGFRRRWAMRRFWWPDILVQAFPHLHYFYPEACTGFHSPVASFCCPWLQK